VSGRDEALRRLWAHEARRGRRVRAPSSHPATSRDLWSVGGQSVPLGRALDESATLVRDWRDQLGDERCILFVETFARWLERERGRVRYAAGRHEAAT
jgi:hypothetical protein